MDRRPRSSRIVDALRWGLPPALTALVAVGYLVAVAVVGTEVEETAGEHGWVPGVLLLAQAALLLARRSVPVLTVLAVVVVDAVMRFVTTGDFSAGTLAVMFAVYTLARTSRTAPSRLLLLAAALADVVITLFAVRTGSSDVPAGWTFPFALLRSVLTFGIPFAIAEIVDGRARLVEALRERAEAAERERERRAEEAVRRERAEMARELHDIAAHHLSGLIVSAQAADALINSDPARASGYLRSVQADARTTLDNLRQTVGLLRSDDRGELAPVPSLEQLPALVEEASAAGTPVRLTETGVPVPLGPLAATAAFRMVQESLANALLHAPGATREVEVGYGDAALTLTVRNGRPAQATRAPDEHRDGYGLIGMAERAELIGATLTTGPVAGGGWQNTLTIPYDGGRA